MTPDPILLLRDNVLEKGNPLGLSKEELCRWAEGLDIPQAGETILYTGCEYQLLPYTPSLLEIAEKMGPFGLRSGGFIGAARALGKMGLDPARLFKSLAARDKEFYDRILQNFARVLQHFGVNFSYLYEEEPYAGSILYEFGFLEELAEHARKVYHIFKKRNVRRIITISPHSLELLQKVYPLYVKDFNITVLHYTQVIAEALQDGSPTIALPVEATATIHDPCHLARGPGIIEEPRSVMRAIQGLDIREVEPTHGRWTGCCGAPLEVLLPRIRELVAQRRLEELRGTGAELIITLCPFCYSNFRKDLQGSGTGIKDLIEILDEAIYQDG